MILEVVSYSIKNKLAHIPSALSQYSYLKYILSQVKDFKIVIGKPFGAQAYYVIWESMYNLPDKLSYGIKHDELDFVEFSEETLGNALGVASGIEIGSGQKVYCNISDGSFQMGPTLEAMQFIGFNKQKILLTVDCNEYQLTGKTTDIIGVSAETISEHFKNYNWNVVLTDNCDVDVSNLELPVVIIYKTKKGHGVKEMEDNPMRWHYKNVKDLNEITFI